VCWLPVIGAGGFPTWLEDRLSGELDFFRRWERDLDGHFSLVWLFVDLKGHFRLMPNVMSVYKDSFVKVLESLAFLLAISIYTMYSGLVWQIHVQNRTE